MWGARSAYDRIVYLEHDWGMRAAGNQSGFPGMEFGRTSLSDVRTRLGSNGAAFKERAPVFEFQSNIVNSNSYELAQQPARQFVTFITVLSDSERDEAIDRVQSGADFSDLAKLNAVILADANYVKVYWGEEVLSPNYSPVNWTE